MNERGCCRYVQYDRRLICIKARICTTIVKEVPEFNILAFYHESLIRQAAFFSGTRPAPYLINGNLPREHFVGLVASIIIHPASAVINCLLLPLQRPLIHLLRLIKPSKVCIEKAQVVDCGEC